MSASAMPPFLLMPYTPLPLTVSMGMLGLAAAGVRVALFACLEVCSLRSSCACALAAATILSVCSGGT